MDTEMQRKKYGPYLISSDATIIDVRTGKKIRLILRNGKYVVGLRMTTQQKKVTYFPLYRLLYKVFINSRIGRYDYIIPIDGNYLNYDLKNLRKISSSEFNKNFNKTCGRKRIVSVEVYQKILELKNQGLSIRKIAAECNISYHTVNCMLKNGYYGEKQTNDK